MKSLDPCVLAINSGSSSIRFAIIEAGDRQSRVLSGKIDRIGFKGTMLTAMEAGRRKQVILRLPRGDRQSAVTFLVDWLRVQPAFPSVNAVGHRIVHGMRHSLPERITPTLIRELQRITLFDPEHLPREITLVKAFARKHPKLPQVACFDTAFHRLMPRVAKTLPIPRRFAERGVERYGFHGLSYSYLMEELRRIDPVAARGRVILAHLGNGASLAAVRKGRSIDTSMGFTPAAGLVMGTRTGDLDPGLVYFLARTERMTAAQFQHMVFHESGLAGVSETSSDLRDLCAREGSDPRAREAVELFCYQARKWIGSFAAVLGGMDTLVFAAGIGENAPSIRRRICEGLGFLGVTLDRTRNARNAPVISAGNGRVKVRVIHTDEELMIARSVARLLGLDKKNRENS